MAGQLTIDTLKASTGVLATQNGMSGIVKAWVVFNGASTPSITGSFNVSSITYNATGDWTMTFTTAMANSTYAYVGSYTNGGNGFGLGLNNNMINATLQYSAPTTTTCRFGARDVTNNPFNPVSVNIIVCGN